MNLAGEKIGNKKIAGKVFGVATLVALFAATVASLPAQAPGQGVARTLAETKLAQDDDVKCLVNTLENGDPDKGASTWILKAPAGCVVAKHFHTAEEQLMVVRGEVLTGMAGMSEKTLGPGGFCDDAGQSGSLVHLHGEDGVPDVCGLRPALRHCVGQSEEITPLSSTFPADARALKGARDTLPAVNFLC